MKLLHALSFFLFSGAALSAALPQAASDTPSTTTTAPPSTGTDTDPDLAGIGDIAKHSERNPPAAALTDAAGDVIELRWAKTEWNIGYLRTSYFLTYRRDGGATFWMRVQNKNKFFPFKYGLACALRDAPQGQPAHVFQMAHDGSVRADSKETVDTVELYSPVIADNWQNILNGDQLMHCVGTEGLDLGTTLNDLKDFVTEWGTIIGGIISIFG